jgi:HEAT repeats
MYWAQGVPESALVDDKYLTRLLGRLAYWLHENKSTGIATEQEVYKELGQEWARIKGLDWDEDNPDIENEVKKFLQAVREHTGLFVERAPKRYGFMHLTFEEYYAARHLIARSRERANLIRKHLHKPRWEEPILLALGFVGLDSPEDAADLLETAILAEGEEAKEFTFTPSQYEKLLGRDFLFALRCLGDNIPVRPKVLKKLIKRLAEEVLYQKGSATFSRYRQALNEKLEYLKGSEGALALNPFIIDALHDTDADVRLRAAESLGSLAQSSQEIVNMLLAALRLAPDSSVRRDSARLLGKIGHNDEQILQALWQGLVDKDNVVRTACAEALAMLGQRFPDIVEIIEKKFIQAIEDPAFDQPDSLFERSGHDYAYDGLWLLVVGGELEGD